MSSDTDTDTTDPNRIPKFSASKITETTAANSNAHSNANSNADNNSSMMQAYVTMETNENSITTDMINPMPLPSPALSNTSTSTKTNHQSDIDENPSLSATKHHALSNTNINSRSAYAHYKPPIIVSLDGSNSDSNALIDANQTTLQSSTPTTTAAITVSVSESGDCQPILSKKPPPIITNLPNATNETVKDVMTGFYPRFKTAAAQPSNEAPTKTVPMSATDNTAAAVNFNASVAMNTIAVPPHASLPQMTVESVNNKPLKNEMTNPLMPVVQQLVADASDRSRIDPTSLPLIEADTPPPLLPIIKPLSTQQNILQTRLRQLTASNNSSANVSSDPSVEWQMTIDHRTTSEAMRTQPYPSQTQQYSQMRPHPSQSQHQIYKSMPNYQSYNDMPPLMHPSQTSPHMSFPAPPVGPPQHNSLPSQPNHPTSQPTPTGNLAHYGTELAQQYVTLQSRQSNPSNLRYSVTQPIIAPPQQSVIHHPHTQQQLQMHNIHYQQHQLQQQLSHVQSQLPPHLQAQRRYPSNPAYPHPTPQYFNGYPNNIHILPTHPTQPTPHSSQPQSTKNSNDITVITLSTTPSRENTPVVDTLPSLDRFPIPGNESCEKEEKAREYITGIALTTADVIDSYLYSVDKTEQDCNITEEWSISTPNPMCKDDQTFRCKETLLTNHLGCWDKDEIHDNHFKPIFEAIEREKESKPGKMRTRRITSKFARKVFVCPRPDLRRSDINKDLRKLTSLKYEDFVHACELANLIPVNEQNYESPKSAESRNGSSTNGMMESKDFSFSSAHQNAYYTEELEPTDVVQITDKFSTIQMRGRLGRVIKVMNDGSDCVLVNVLPNADQPHIVKRMIAREYLSKLSISEITKLVTGGALTTLSLSHSASVDSESEPPIKVEYPKNKAKSESQTLPMTTEPPQKKRGRKRTAQNSDKLTSKDGGPPPTKRRRRNHSSSTSVSASIVTTTVNSSIAATEGNSHTATAEMPKERRSKRLRKKVKKEKRGKSRHRSRHQSRHRSKKRRSRRTHHSSVDSGSNSDSMSIDSGSDSDSNSDSNSYSSDSSDSYTSNTSSYLSKDSNAHTQERVSDEEYMPSPHSKVVSTRGRSKKRRDKNSSTSDKDSKEDSIATRVKRSRNKSSNKHGRKKATNDGTLVSVPTNRKSSRNTHHRSNKSKTSSKSKSKRRHRHRKRPQLVSSEVSKQVVVLSSESSNASPKIPPLTHALQQTQLQPPPPPQHHMTYGMYTQPQPGVAMISPPIIPPLPAYHRNNPQLQTQGIPPQYGGYPTNYPNHRY